MPRSTHDPEQVTTRLGWCFAWVAVFAAIMAVMYLASIATAQDAPTVDIRQPADEQYRVVDLETGEVLEGGHTTRRIAQERALNLALANPSREYAVQPPLEVVSARVPDQQTVTPPANFEPAELPAGGYWVQPAIGPAEGEYGAIGQPVLTVVHQPLVFAAGDPRPRVEWFANVRAGDKIVVQSWHGDGAEGEQLLTDWLTDADAANLQIVGDPDADPVATYGYITAASLRNLPPGLHVIQMWIIPRDGELSPSHGVGNKQTLTIEVSP